MVHINKSLIGRWLVPIVLMLSLHQLLDVLSPIAKREMQPISSNLRLTKAAVKKRPKIAMVSGFVPSSMYKDAPRIKLLDHVINKACYAKLWGYDYIFNTTYGFDPSIHRHWLEYGCWNIVPHIQDRLQDYDWILYGDLDYVIKDMTRPLESFLNEFELYGKHPSVFVPRDFNRGSYYTFSSFAILIKNDAFGRRVLKNWMDFAKGLCKNGNFPSVKGKYEWYDGDQPGLWYALVKTHMEFFPPEVPEPFPVCNETTGLLDAEPYFNQKINDYFGALKTPLGNYGSDLDKVKDDQPIIWSWTRNDSRAGLAVQADWGDEVTSHAFAIHKKKMDWPGDMLRELEICKKDHGCYAEYSEDGKLEIGCDGVQFPVDTGNGIHYRVETGNQTSTQVNSTVQ